MNSGQVTLNSSTATSIVAAANINTVYVGRGTSPIDVALYNSDNSIDVYLGGSSAVTSSNGFKLLHGTSLKLSIDANDAIYGLAVSGSPVVHFLST